MTAGAQAKGWYSSWWIPMVVGLLSLVCGILALVWPGVTLLALALIAGINLTVLSAFLIGEGIADDEAPDRTLRIVLGVLGVITGLIVMRRPGETLLVLIIALGIWLVMDGAIEVIRAFLRGTQHRVLLILGGLIDVGLGIALLVWPKLGLGTVAILVGIGFVVRGIMLMFSAWRLRGVAHAAADAGGATPLRPTPA
ncbi:hypothetical protein DSM104299_02756 [Baekduia alba]|uniref:HdeD family acid-resistance protein n=1 Tax=Baekduia alba TaxID=2997333 RepID=UPI002340AB58|nr:DUF308 domain-containing protein [Baekduia alba]WCB94028.1 hypothetical protein DSM104299_02756 [Baekduia alba]